MMWICRASRPILVLLNMSIILAICLLGIQELREAIITVPGYTEWTTWTPCSKTCNTGVRKRHRFCTNPPPSLFGPRNCSHQGLGYEVISCSTTKCPVDGNFGAWSRFGKCSKSCGGGEQTRVRLCVNPPPQFDGKDCSSHGPYIEKTSCNEQPCPVDGGFTEWSAWSKCSITCGPGQHHRKRTCSNPLPRHGGKNCSALGENTETKECQSKLCPVDGGYSGWEDWGTCSVSCGGGTRTRERKCNSPLPSSGGKDCSSLGTASESENCGMHDCDIDGGYTDWSAWSSCSATCGEAVQKRKRTCTNPKPSGKGKSCYQLGASIEILDCDLGPCA